MILCLRVSPSHTCCGRHLETVYFTKDRDQVNCPDCRKVIDRKGMFTVTIG